MTKQEIFTKAHEMARTFEGDYAACFKLALITVYAQMKAPQFVSIKNWFVEKNFNDHERYVASTSGFTVVKESEKAVQLLWDSEFGKMFKWVPKSCMINQEEAIAIMDNKVSRFEKYENLVKWAKENNVKGVRSRMKKTTIIIKIQEAGLTVPAELV